ncbi:hypothetical protein ONS95_007029 [Cadophora gregata]|uniref:uncharacterized protein n=1 Tax=Cadophora gregata TaxID=51156 RepID=UPI0026DC48FC|nr:uncharacterized protein ONS95_007029 [Cadophora gregata]KAK0100571.1 hypothetical protein ONS95_007029 [Cadophora gregata]KAK0117430.1 hypothetical protein ONS96_013260 [Cadophora gregata f. sp. sojae]
MDVPTTPPTLPRPTLSCERCKRRKIKCDRSLPKCWTCVKTSRECSYPLVSNKPGPKPGVLQRRRARTDNSSEGGASSYQNNNHAPGSVSIEPTTPASLPSTEPRIERSPSRGLALSQLLQLSHEPFPQNTTSASGQGDRSQNYHLVIENICNAFEISSEAYKLLMDAYFQNMTSFSLFHKPSFDAKLSAISSSTQLQALVASMFSFSSRFIKASTLKIPTPRHFYDLASKVTETAIQDCADEVFPLHLLQTLLHITFQQLTEGVRGRAWRSLGTCVRTAYELQLHLIDKLQNNRTSSNAALDEEKRRAWWVIWEFDVFASTIRRLPTAIDWKENETWLPVDDEAWFANESVSSCRLEPDPALAWKCLQKSGNTSAKAWFIVANALVRCAHLLSYPQTYSAASAVEAGEVPRGLDILANSLYCLTTALPPDLIYKGEFLSFSCSSLQTDTAKHCVHIMTQLSRFMLNHYQVFDSTSRHLGEKASSSTNTTDSSTLTPLDQTAWNHYLTAAASIVTLLRNCPLSHVQYANPFLASTIWLAAAAQVVSKSFGDKLVDPRVADSNLDVLQMNLNAFVEFWGVSDALRVKLRTLENKLKVFAESRGAESEPGGPSQLLSAARADDMVVQGSQSQMVSMQSTGWIGGNEGYVNNMWAEPRFDILNPSMMPDMNLNLWGWGMDELMNYGGIE